MRIGIFSDIHANIEALSAVLEAYKSERIDKYICLGDTVGYGASPNECCDLVRKHAAFCILGNPRRRGRRTHGLLVLLRRRAVRRSTCTRPRSPRRTWTGCAPLPYQRRDGILYFCHGSPPQPGRVRLHLRARAGGALPGDLRRARRRDLHRPLAPVQVVSRSPGTRSSRWSRRASSSGPGTSTS